MPATCATRLVVRDLTKSFGAVRAVDGLSFTAEPGTVTGFLGPNGAGKTTTLRMLLGLVTPDAGEATIGGERYVDLEQPTHRVGAALETSGVHPARSGRDHLRVHATVAGLPDRRVDEVLDLVGLRDAATRRAGGYSLGMRQRLALATALLGDPDVLVLDEPANGLDPAGIRWMRDLLRRLADEGRTVLVSSHVLAEVRLLVDHVVIVRGGRLVHEGALDTIAGGHRTVAVRTPEADRLRTALERAEAATVRIERPAPDRLRVVGADAATVGGIAHAERVELRWLATEEHDLEQVFLTLTGEVGATTDAHPQER